MKLRLLLCIPLAFAVACSKSKKSKSGSPDPKTACMNKIVPTAGGQEITAEQIASGKDIQWKLDTVEMFQSVEGGGKSLFIAIQANEGNAFQASRICGGGSPDFDGDFEMKVPESINGRNGIATSLLQMTVKSNAQTMNFNRASIRSGFSERVVFLKKDGAQHKVIQINPWTLEIWASFPLDEGTGTGRGVFRAVYRSSQTPAVSQPGGQPTAPQPVVVQPAPQPAPQPGNGAQQGTLELYQDAYNYAYGSHGLNLDRAPAMSFASKVSGMGAVNGARYLKVYKQAYLFFYSSNGVSLDRAPAMQWTDAVASTTDPETTFETFKKSYNFAYGSNGLNLDRGPALKFAAEQAQIKPL